MDTKQPNALRLADALGRAPKWQQLQAAAELRRLHAEIETLRKTNTAARGTDAQIIKERELCAYAFAGAIADGLSGGAGPDTQNAEWLRPAFEAGQEIAQLRAEIATLRKREEKLCKRCTPVCQGGEGCFSGMPQATHVRMVAFDVQPVEDEFVTREGWVESAMRVYLIAGDSEGQARECAEYLWVEADMDDLPDPIAAAMEDVEGRGPEPEASPTKAGEYPELPKCKYAESGDIKDFGLFDASQMRAYADATCAARAATTASAPVVLPEPVAAQSRFADTPSDTWDSCSVEHARSFGGVGYEVRYLYTEQQVRAMLATATGLPAQAARTWRGGNMTVADLVNNLLMMDQSLPIYGAQTIEHPQGRRRVIAIHPTVSRERVKDSRWIGEGNELNAAIIWTRAEQPTAPQALDARKFLRKEDLERLHRFIETTEDDESYDIGKDEVKRLAEIGVVCNHGFGRYSVTAFGYWAHESDWEQCPNLPLKTNSDRDAEQRAAIAAAKGE